MARTRQGSSVKKGLKFFVYGEQGTWKSSFALDAIKLTDDAGKPLRVAYIDTEGGSVDSYLEDVEHSGYDLDNLFLVYANSFQEVYEWVEKFIANEEIYLLDDDGYETEEKVLDADGKPFVADMIILDSATVIQDTLKYSKILTSEKRAKLRAKKKENSTAADIFVAEATAGLEFKDYDKLNQEGKHLLHSLVHKTDKYVCVIAREKEKKEMRKAPDGTFTSVTVGTMPDCFKGAEYEFFTVLRMFKKNEDDNECFAQIMRKDRTKQFAPGEIIKNPTIQLWQNVIMLNSDKPNAMLVSDYNTAINRDVDKTAKEVVEEDEQIDGLYDSIVAKFNSFNSTQKQATVKELKKNNLPSKPARDMNIETLEKILSVLSSI